MHFYIEPFNCTDIFDDLQGKFRLVSCTIRPEPVNSRTSMPNSEERQKRKIANAKHLRHLRKGSVEFRLLEGFVSGKLKKCIRSLTSGKSAVFRNVRQLYQDVLQIEVSKKEARSLDVYELVLHYLCSWESNEWDKFQDIFDEYFPNHYEKSWTNLSQQRIPVFQRTPFLKFIFRTGVGPSLSTVNNLWDQLRPLTNKVPNGLTIRYQIELELRLIQIRTLEKRSLLSEIAEYLEKTDTSVDTTGYETLKNEPGLDKLMESLTFPGFYETPSLFPLKELVAKWSAPDSMIDLNKQYLSFYKRGQPYFNDAIKKLHLAIHRELLIDYCFNNEGEIDRKKIQQLSKNLLDWQTAPPLNIAQEPLKGSIGETNIPPMLKMLLNDKAFAEIRQILSA